MNLKISRQYAISNRLFGSSITRCSVTSNGSCVRRGGGRCWDVEDANNRWWRLVYQHARSVVTGPGKWQNLQLLSALETPAAAAALSDDIASQSALICSFHSLYWRLSSRQISPIFSPTSRGHVPQLQEREARECTSHSGFIIKLMAVNLQALARVKTI